jgi:hypothetical protein
VRTWAAPIVETPHSLQSDFDIASGDCSNHLRLVSSRQWVFDEKSHNNAYKHLKIVFTRANWWTRMPSITFMAAISSYFPSRINP